MKKKKKRNPPLTGQSERCSSLSDENREVGGDASPVGLLSPAERRARKARARVARLDETARKKEEARRDARLAELDKTDGAKTFFLKVRWREHFFICVVDWGHGYPSKCCVREVRHAISCKLPKLVPYGLLKVLPVMPHALYVTVEHWYAVKGPWRLLGKYSGGFVGRRVASGRLLRHGMGKEILPG